MDDVFVYFVSLPPGINEMVVPCADGFSVYIDVNLDKAHRINAYQHAMRHINNNDFEKEDVQQIEAVAHEKISREIEPAKPKPRRRRSFASKLAKYEEWHRKLQNKHGDRYLDIMLDIIERDRLDPDR